MELNIPLIDGVKRYLISHFSVELQEIDLLIPPMPIQLRNSVQVHVVALNGLIFYLIESKNSSLYEVEGKVLLHKLRERLVDHPCLFVASHFSYKATKSLIEERLAFIVPGERAYIPEFMLHEDYPIKKSYSLPSKALGIVPANIVAHYLEGNIGQTFTTSELPLELSKAAISRSLKELETYRLVDIRKNGRVNQIRFLISRKDIWDKREEIFPQIASQVITVPKRFCLDFDILAGESALSVYTLMGEPQRECIAMYFRSSQRYAMAINQSTLNGVAISHLTKIAETLGYSSEDMKYQDWNEDVIDIQLFPYKPTFNELRDRQVLSPIFLSLSAGSKRDPRIKNSFNELFENIKTKLMTLDEDSFVI